MLVAFAPMLFAAAGYSLIYLLMGGGLAARSSSSSPKCWVNNRLPSFLLLMSARAGAKCFPPFLLAQRIY